MPILVIASLLSAQVWAAEGTPVLSQNMDQPATEAPGVYIVQMRQAPIMAKQSRRGLPLARKPARTDAVVQAAVIDSRNRQDSVLAELGRPVTVLHRYHFALDGFSARLSPVEAAHMSRLPAVERVFRDSERQLTTDASARFLGLTTPETGLYSLGLRGENQIIGIIDSGITPEAASFRDTRPADSPRACRSNWGQNSLLGRWLCGRYRRRPDVVEYEPLETWQGTCQAGEAFESDVCNNKLLGARFYIDGALELGPVDPGEFLSPRDADGHGTHIAATAAGNRTPATLNGSTVANIQGIAPRARIAAYKACWLRPGGTRASCVVSDLVRAIDDAVADGVDIINYSIGNTQTTLTNADDVALLNATRAGVVVVVAAGNDGPALGTIGSPASSPWVITVGAASREGQRFVPAIRINSPDSLAGSVPSLEADFTPRLEQTGEITGNVVAYDDDDISVDNGQGSTIDGCQDAINGSELTGNIALIQRGGCEFATKIRNAQAAGADAVVVYSDLGGPVLMLGDGTDIDIPAVMIGQADGQQIRDALTSGEAVEVTLANGLFATEPDTGNVLGRFSSRGPALAAPGILKPDVVAPGVNILSAISPDIANGQRGQQFGYLTGTSMAAPHVAGIVALLREANPERSPAALRSALMTSARQSVVQSNGTTAANPFDIGAGHVVPNDALDPGLVFDVQPDDYDRFTCSVEDFPIDQSRCETLTAQGAGALAQDLNQASISIPALTGSTRVDRTATATRTDTWQATLLLPAGFSGAVSPSTLSLAAGESATFSLQVEPTATVEDSWYFGAIDWVASNGQRVRNTVAFRPVQIDAPREVRGNGGTGSADFDVSFGYDGPYTGEIAGLIPAVVTNLMVDADPNRNFTRRTSDGVTARTITLPADQLFLRLALYNTATDGIDEDLDLYVYYCPTSTSCREVGRSTEPESDELIDIAGPGPGLYEIYVHGFTIDDVTGGPGSNFSLYSWVLPNRIVGNASVSGPGSVQAGTTETVTLNWNALNIGQRYFGLIVHSGAAGPVALTRVSINNE